MSVTLAEGEQVAGESSGPRPRTRENQTRRTSSTSLTAIWKIAIFFWKYLVAVALCQVFLGSILVVGWTYRLMQRTALKKWWKKSQLRSDGVTFGEFVADSQSFGHLCHWPNWILGQHSATGPQSKPRWGAVLCGSLWLNGKVGIQAIFNTWVLTMPACVLWLFAWFAGWNNSFNKGYEQATVGPLTGGLGAVLFIAAMFYVPMAQARQAATGSFLAFYEFRFVWRLVKNRWLGCLKLAVLYSLLSLPVIMLKTAPAFFPQINSALEDVTDAEILRILNWYYLASAAFVFASFVLLKLSAARTYAAALLYTVTTRRVEPEELHLAERTALGELGLLRLQERPQRHLIIRTVTGGGRFVKGTTVGLATAVVWFAFVSQIFVSEFLSYHPVDRIQCHFLGGWLNQPLVQLPWFNYTPGDLRERV
ncbi:MAG: DUF4013 domain-containing protein [Planctomycetes bacterium]|nr:DUF4013 domain-containing protein [Planctomycetota bacterium]